jgi:periplasmic divalent cation tolerance protein
MEKPLLVYTTFPDVDTALSIGEGLVNDKLIACINVFPAVTSVYAWEGSTERGTETAAVLKTRLHLKTALEDALRARHPYDTPSVFFIEPSQAMPETLAWLVSET